MRYTTTYATRIRHILPGVMFALMLMATPALQAQTANGYVIYCNNYSLFLSHDASTGAVITTGVSTFDPATCLWTVGTYIRPASTNGTTVLGNLYLCPRNGNNSYTLNTTTSTTYRAWNGGLANNGQPYYGTNRYLRVTGGTTWQIGTTNSNRGTVYAVTSTSTAEDVAAAYAGTLSGTTELIGAGATSTVTPTATHTAAYNLTKVTYSYSGGELGSTTTGTVPTPTAVSLASGWTLNWSLSDDTYATISNTGVVTVKSTLPATYATTTVNLTATRTDGTDSFTASLPLTIYASAEIQTNVVGGTQGISGGVVTLNDYEDHSWSYYSDSTLPARMRSLNPANVVIKYYGNGTANVSTSTAAAPALTTFTASTNNSVAVGIGEPESTFVYYKTLERTSGTAYGSATYDYTTIPNPFSIRPTNGTGDTRWRGFYAWRVKSVSGGTISGKAVDDIIDAEATISFIPDDEYGMTVELEALWAAAEVTTGTTFSNGYNSVERNFMIVSNAATSTMDNVRSGSPCTYSSFYPNGTTNGTTAATLAGRATRRATFTPTADSKIEYMLLNGNSYDISANAHNLTLGRGIGAAGGTYSCNNFSSINSNQTADLDFNVRVESGVYNRVYLMSNNNSISGRVRNHLTFGSDYDRAGGDNSKLSVAPTNQINFATPVLGEVNKDQPVLDINVKSGEYQRNYWYDNNTSAYNFSFYCHSTVNESYPGLVSLTVEGGHFANINGGRGSETEGHITDDSLAFTMRFRGGLVENSIYGAASNQPPHGSRRLIFTGGEAKGWIAAGDNGTSGDDSRVHGDSYVYIGGKMKVGNDTASRSNNATPGGNVFGAGRGNATHRASVKTSHVAVADEAEVLHDIYGGGFHGHVVYTSNVFVLGGTVHGSVFGGGSENGPSGAYTKDIPTVNITMTGGLVEGGVYGGSNTTGIVSNQVNVQINGGQVGTSSNNANVHGGGYGPETAVNGNVNVTLGDTPATTGGATVYGNVYGGSALGDVNTNGTNTTTVTIDRGTVNGNVFGGALGVGADVHGKVTVNMNGGTVNGNVYGGGDEAAYSPSSDHPVVQQTGGTADNVFGGGRGATAVVTGNPQVTLSGTAHVKGNVYGGGHAANVTGNPHVTIQD